MINDLRVADMKLPAANEFTPGQLGGVQSLFTLLDLIEAQMGDRDAVVETIRQKWFSDSASSRNDIKERREQQSKRAANVISGMRQYGLITESKNPLVLTDLGRAIFNEKGSSDDGIKLLTTFLLRERHGIELLEIAKGIRNRDGAVSKKAVDLELRVRGYSVSTNSSYSGKLRQWLEPSGVVDNNWVVNDDIFVELSGVSSEGISSWRSLTFPQRAALEVLRIRAVGNGTPLPSSTLLEMLRQRGVEFEAGQVRKTIYDPLVAGGWITHVVGKGGRGGKGGSVLPTAKTLAMDGDLVDGLQLGNIPTELQEHIGLPTQEILRDLGSADTGTKGIALELLSLRLASDIGLLPADLRLRSSQTGGAEVDLVAEAAHLHFSRWLFQCKNQTAPVGVSVLAKEIGMATLLRAQVVAIVTTSTFSKTVREYAKQAAETTSIQVILLDKTSLSAYQARGPSALREELHALSVDALSYKRDQLWEVPKEVPAN
ncbi:restriction endonuclease [Mycetocola zhujimingii]|uniref:restriction endonuclease n=1 Tax=Mycetocola zhujimingii TaxID=2079792 RepID=UPI000D342706|nr:restriction endonuclease [Mycetocola zhujimingii]AWB87742.1 hypothetical protein C3E77_14800 [Mycetocola zhujimingii]